MEADVFWELMEGACRMGRFVAAVPNAAASANIVGRLETGYDGDERVLQKKKRPNSHVHFKPELISKFAFIHLDTGFGPEPCIELRASTGQPVARLYYQGKKAVARYDEFMKRNSSHEAFIEGSWAQPEASNAEREDGDGASAAGASSATTSENESIFVSSHHETDAEDAPVV